MVANGVLIRVALVTALPAIFLVAPPLGHLPTRSGAHEREAISAEMNGARWRQPQGGTWDQAEAAGSFTHRSEEAMQPIYQGTQQVISFFSREIDSVLSQAVSHLQNVARAKVGASDQYALAWNARERTPIAIMPVNSSVGFSQDEIQFLTRHGAWVTVREGPKERLILVSVHSVGANAILSAAFPLARITSPLESFRLARNGRLFLLDSVGNTLNNPGKRLSADRNSLLKMLDGDLGTLETRSDIISYSRIPTTDWFALLEIPKNEAQHGVVFPSEQQLRLNSTLEPPTEVVRLQNWAAWLAPAGGFLLFLILGGFTVPLVLGKRRAARIPKPRKSRSSLPLPGFPDPLEVGLDLPDTPLVPGPNLEKGTMAWAIEETTVPEGRGELGSTTRIKMALRQQARDTQRMLQQLHNSMDLTISENRDQIYEVLNAHQGKLKALTVAFENTRGSLLHKAEGDALVGLIEGVKTKLFQAEADHRQVFAGVEKRLSSLGRKLNDLESGLGKSVSELQDKVTDDLLGRQETINKAMEVLEGKTREAQRQVLQDSASAKASAAHATQQAAALEADFQEQKTRNNMEIEELRRHASADVGVVREKLAHMEDLRSELKDCIANFQAGRSEYEEIGRNLSRRVNEELSALQQRLFDKEGDTEKLRILVDQALKNVATASSDFEIRRDHIDRDLDALKGKVFLTEEELQRLGDQGDRRFEEAATDVDRRLSAHIAETEKRVSEVVAEAQANAMAAIARLDAARLDDRSKLEADFRYACEKADDVAARGERARARLEDQLMANVQAAEDRLIATGHEALSKLGDLQAEVMTQQEAFRNEIGTARERDSRRLEDLDGKIARLEVRTEQARARLEDQLKMDLHALHQDLTGRHMLQRDELVSAQEVFQADMREEWLNGRKEDRDFEQKARQDAIDGVSQQLQHHANEVQASADQFGQTVALELQSYQDLAASHRSQLEGAIGALSRQLADGTAAVSDDFAAAKYREDAIGSRIAELEANIVPTLHGQIMQEAATSQDMARRLESRVNEAAEGAKVLLEELGAKVEMLIGSAIAALPDHPELIGIHRDIEQLGQEAYQGREDLEGLRELVDRNGEQYSKLAGLVQLLLKLYQTAKETDDKVSKVLGAQQNKVEGLHQEVLAMRSMVKTKPPPTTSGAPIPLA